MKYHLNRALNEVWKAASRIVKNSGRSIGSAANTVALLVGKAAKAERRVALLQQGVRMYRL